MTTFTDLGLAKPLLSALAGQGYETPTPIQAQAIPPVLSGRDLLGIAQTGTGKTAAFALPILHRLAQDRRPAARRTCRALVLSPTRELASQIADSFRVYGKGIGVNVTVVFGGVKHTPQARALIGGVDVLVATPGRLLDHIDERNIDLGPTEVFVLDEADQMLDLGFVKPIRQIAGRLPENRQNLFFSATMPGEIGKLAGELLRDPVKVQVTPAATTVERIAQKVMFVEASKKRALLAELFADDAFSRTLVFTRTKHGADRVASFLEAGGVAAAAIHGNKSQPQRERALKAFKDGKIRALVATDIAARGIDIDAVTHVVNYELPNVPESYVHRIGRTARAGASGSAVSFCADDERSLLRDIERTTRQSIPSEDRRKDRDLAGLDAAISAVAPPEAPRPERPRQGRPQGQRGEGHRSHAPGRGRGDGGRGEGARSEHPRRESRREEPRAHAPRAEDHRGRATPPDERARGVPPARGQERQRPEGKVSEYRSPGHRGGPAPGEGPRDQPFRGRRRRPFGAK